MTKIEIMAHHKSDPGVSHQWLTFFTGVPGVRIFNVPDGWTIESIRVTEDMPTRSIRDQRTEGP